MSPTYELALQTGKVIETMGKSYPEVKLIYGIRGNKCKDQSCLIGQYSPNKLIRFATSGFGRCPIEMRALAFCYTPVIKKEILFSDWLADVTVCVCVTGHQRSR